MQAVRLQSAVALDILPECKEHLVPKRKERPAQGAKDFPFYSIVIDINNSYALLNLIFPGKFSREERFQIDKPREPSGEYFTAEQAADYLKVHVDTFRKWVRLGKIPRVPLPGSGKDFRFRRASLDEWARGRELR
jgi:excisionase family DNA binding protein